MTRTGLPGERCRNRAVEWLCSLMLIFYALTVLVTPDTLDEGSYRYLTALGITPVGFVLITATIGMSRVFALYFNGYGLPHSARIRALGAVLGGVVFAVMGLSVAYLANDTRWLPMGAGQHFLLAAFELYSCLRAGADVYEKYHRDAVSNIVAACAERSGQ